MKKQKNKNDTSQYSHWCKFSVQVGFLQVFPATERWQFGLVICFLAWSVYLCPILRNPPISFCWIWIRCLEHNNPEAFCRNRSNPLEHRRKQHDDSRRCWQFHDHAGRWRADLQHQCVAALIWILQSPKPYINSHPFLANGWKHVAFGWKAIDQCRLWQWSYSSSSRCGRNFRRRHIIGVIIRVMGRGGGVAIAGAVAGAGVGVGVDVGVG